MSEIVEDRIKQTSTSTGAGNMVLSGAVTGFRLFSDRCAIGDTFYGTIVAVSASGVPTGDWETGYYTYSALNTITRTTIHSSSNLDAAVTFGVGNKYISIEMTATQVRGISTVLIDSSARPTVPDDSPYTSVCFQEEFTSTVFDTAKFNTKIWYDVEPAVANYNVSADALTLWPMTDPTSGLYTPRTIDTDGKYYQRYGFFEIEAMLPVGYGVLPAFWLFAHNDDTRPEIAIMKAYCGAQNAGNVGWSNTSDQPTSTHSIVHTGVNLLGENKLATLLGARNDLHNKFHKYGMHWSATQVKFYFDGALMGDPIDITGNTIMQQRMYMVMSLWYGSLSGNPDSPPAGVSKASVASINAFKINYLRAWRLAGVAIQNDETPPLTTESGGPTPPPAPNLLELHGDSTMWGSDGAAMNDGATRVATPPHVIMANALPSAPVWTITNEAVTGSSIAKLRNGTDGVHPAWSTYLTNTNATKVIMNFGINDTYEAGNTTALFTTNYNAVIDAARIDNVEVIIQTNNETDDSQVDAYRNAAIAVASNKGCALIDVYTYIRNYRIANGLTIYQMCPDGYHPNQATYNLIFAYVAQRFNEITTGVTPAPAPTPTPGPTPTPTATLPATYIKADPSLAYSTIDCLNVQAMGTNTAPGSVPATGIDGNTTDGLKNFQKVADPDAATKSAYLFQVAQRDPGGTDSTRTELAWGSSNKGYSLGTTYWTGFRVRVGTNMRNDTAGDELIVMQIHDNSGVTGLNPNVAMWVTSGGTAARMNFTIRYNQITPLIKANQVSRDLMSVAYNANQWYTFVCQFKLHWDTGQGAFFKLWKDGVLVVDDALPNDYRSGQESNTGLRSYQKLGAYHYLGTEWTAGDARTVHSSGIFGYVDNGSITESMVRTQVETLPAPTPAPTPTPAPSPSRAIRGPDASLFKPTPTFFDEFDGTTLSGRWNRGVWYDHGVPAGTVRLNQSCLEMCSEANMPLTGNNTSYVSVDTDPNNQITNGFDQRYGFWQCEAKLPIGRGYWPAFWLFGHPGVKRPEIDIFEAYPGGAGWSSADRAPHPTRADTTIHPLNDPGGYQATSVNFSLTPDGLDLSAAFHTYGCLWDSNVMRFYFDGTLIRSVTNADTMAYFAAAGPMYILFDFGLGSAAGDRSSDRSISPIGFGSDPLNVAPNVFRINYVSCWQFTKY